MKQFFMSGPVATCAGSAGGSQPPPDPTRLPSYCESVPDAAPRSRAGRGMAVGKAILEKVQREGKINIVFDENTWKVVGKNSAYFDSAVGIHMRDICDPSHGTWKDVPQEHKRRIQSRMLDWFNLDYDRNDGIIREVVDRDASKCYKDWKATLHRHFKKMGGVENDAYVRQHPPKNLKPEQWGPVCDRFVSPEFQKKSTTNQQNRSSHKWTSLHGRKSYSQHRFDKGNLETREPRSLIDNWGDMHRHGQNYVTSDAEQAFTQMEGERTRHITQSAGEGSSASGQLVDESEILSQVLGKRRGHMRGIGPTLSRRSQSNASTSSSSAHSDGTSSAPLPLQVQSWLNNLYIEQCNMFENQQIMMDVVRQINPNVNFRPINRPQPFVPPPERADEQDQSNDVDDDVTNQGD